MSSSIIANHLQRFDGNITNYYAGFKQLELNYQSMLQHFAELDTMWTSESKDELTNKFNDDRKRGDEMITNLMETYKEMKFAHTEYTTCEKRVEGIIAQL